MKATRERKEEPNAVIMNHFGKSITALRSGFTTRQT